MLHLRQRRSAPCGRTLPQSTAQGGGRREEGEGPECVEGALDQCEARELPWGWGGGEGRGRCREEQGGVQLGMLGSAVCGEKGSRGLSSIWADSAGSRLAEFQVELARNQGPHTVI